MPGVEAPLSSVLRAGPKLAWRDAWGRQQDPLMAEMRTDEESLPVLLDAEPPMMRQSSTRRAPRAGRRLRGRIRAQSIDDEEGGSDRDSCYRRGNPGKREGVCSSTLEPPSASSVIKRSDTSAIARLRSSRRESSLAAADSSSTLAPRLATASSSSRTSSESCAPSRVSTASRSFETSSLVAACPAHCQTAS